MDWRLGVELAFLVFGALFFFLWLRAKDREVEAKREALYVRAKYDQIREEVRHRVRDELSDKPIDDIADFLDGALSDL